MKFKYLAVISLLLLIMISWVACMHKGNSGDPALPDHVSYNFNIRPILSDKCFKCHGPDANKRAAGWCWSRPEGRQG